MEVRLCDYITERELVDEFCRQVFGSTSAETLTSDHKASSSNYANPFSDGPSPTAIAIHEGVVIGHVTSTPFLLWIKGNEKLAYWLGGIHVFPEYRGMGIARKLASCITNSLPIVTGVARVEPSIKAFKATNWVWPGRIADYIHIVNPTAFLSRMSGDKVERFVPKLLRPAAGIALKVLRVPLSLGIKTWKGISGVKRSIRKGEQIQFEEVEQFESDIDRLWEVECKNYTLTNVRRADYLNWQFPTSRGWRKSVSYDSGVAKSWAIYAIKTYSDGGQLEGLKALNVIDAFWDSSHPESLKNLIDYFIFRAYAEGTDIIMFSGEHHELKRSLGKRAFFKLPSTIWAGFHSVGNEYDFEQAFSGAYITRGYADAAGGLGPELP